MSLPLAVDLDGTLIRSDVLFESAAVLLGRKPWLAFAMPVWLLGGKARMKREIATRVSVDAALLPYNQEFVDWLRAEKQRGRTIVLATASDQLLADSIARHLPLFDDVIGSNGTVNLKGAGKLATLNARYGREFAYAGNSSSDLEIWRGCEEAVVVNASPSTAAAARKVSTVTREFPPVRLTYGLVRQVLRGRGIQLILLGALLMIMLTRNPLWALAGIAASLLSAGSLIVLDVLSIEQHRRNRRLAQGPVASGTFPISIAFFLGPALALLGLALALYITWRSAG